MGVAIGCCRSCFSHLTISRARLIYQCMELRIVASVTQQEHDVPSFVKTDQLAERHIAYVVETGISILGWQVR